MVKGLRSPDIILVDLMKTYNSSKVDIFFKLRLPASVPFLFTSMKVAIAISLVGAIVGELPTGAVAGLGARLLTGSYYGQTIQIWSALIMASILAATLVFSIQAIGYLVSKKKTWLSIQRILGSQNAGIPEFWEPEEYGGSHSSGI